MRNLLVLNIYRNINKNVENKSASAEDIRKWIKSQRVAARNETHKTRDCVIVGDFNTHDFELEEDLVEITDPQIFHQHNDSCAKTYIDRVWTNIDSARLVEVFKTCENKQNNASGKLGHKPFMISIGERHDTAKTVTQTSNKEVKQIAKRWKKCNSLVDTDYPDTKEGIEAMSLELMKRTTECVEAATKTRLKTPKSSNQVAMDYLNSVPDDQVNTKKAASSMYAFVDLVTGPAETTNKAKPDLKEFKVMAEAKMRNLVRPNRTKALETARLIWAERPKIEHHFPTRHFFRAILKTGSNSCAKDVFGISPRLLKIFIKSSTGAFESFYLLSAKIARVGVIPKCWKQDAIFFLYKRKNSRMDPKQYRPVTIAVAYIKLFCKVMMDKFSLADDLNYLNHAYCKNRSCLSAIFEVQEAIRRIKIKSEALRGSEFEIIPIILCEDISSAFESIYHEVLLEYVSLNFTDTADFKLSALTKSYLDREARITDRETGESLEFNKTWDDQSSPQGSSASPPWWRIFDNCVTRIYSDAVNKVVAECEDIVSFENFSYSDDKMTIIGLRIKKTDTRDMVRTKIKVVAGVCRRLLDEATRMMGCSINLTKSEIVVRDDLEDKDIPEKDKLLKANFVWLGYSLNTENCRLNFTLTKMTTRLEKARRDYTKVFQKMPSIAIRRKVFMVYIKPIVEWFVPVVAMNKRTDRKKMDPLEAFQHQALAAVLKMTKNVSRFELSETMHETTIDMKTGLFAEKNWRNFKRDLKKLKNVETSTAKMGLRSGKVKDQVEWSGVDKHDFGDNMIMIKEIFGKSETEIPVTSEFDMAITMEWKRNKIAQISARIGARLNGHFE